MLSPFFHQQKFNWIPTFYFVNTFCSSWIPEYSCPVLTSRNIHVTILPRSDTHHVSGVSGSHLNQSCNEDLRRNLTLSIQPSPSRKDSSYWKQASWSVMTIDLSIDIQKTFGLNKPKQSPLSRRFLNKPSPSTIDSLTNPTKNFRRIFVATLAWTTSPVVQSVWKIWSSPAPAEIKICPPDIHDKSLTVPSWILSVVARASSSSSCIER